MYEQPTDHIPHESHSVLIVSWDSERPSKSLSQLTILVYRVWSLSAYSGIKDLSAYIGIKDQIVIIRAENIRS